MVEPKLEKSKALVQRGFLDLPPLSKSPRPLHFTEAGLQEDMRRLESELSGWVLNDHGEKIIVVAQKAADADNFLYVEMLDAASGERLGHVTFLFRPAEKDFLIGFLNLKAIKGRGFGRSLTDKFRAFIPAGVKMHCIVEEAHTRKFLLHLTQRLMESGEITDWTLTSPLRPTPAADEKIFLPEPDQEKLQSRFLEKAGPVHTPIFSLLQTFHASFHSLRACLTGTGNFAFYLTYVC